MKSWDRFPIHNKIKTIFEYIFVIFITKIKGNLQHRPPQFLFYLSSPPWCLNHQEDAWKAPVPQTGAFSFIILTKTTIFGCDLVNGSTVVLIVKQDLNIIVIPASILYKHWNLDSNFADAGRRTKIWDKEQNQFIDLYSQVLVHLLRQLSKATIHNGGSFIFDEATCADVVCRNLFCR